MKILEKGNLEKIKNTRKFTCIKCGCLFEADESEYKYCDAFTQQHDGVAAECKCPMCGADAFSDCISYR